ncbi:MAG TPA: hypothetical protein QGF58_11430 [Myxococcota bacterium]|nr:hypothetical protein [Myxococcota bacterium]
MLTRRCLLGGAAALVLACNRDPGNNNDIDELASEPLDVDAYASALEEALAGTGHEDAVAPGCAAFEDIRVLLAEHAPISAAVLSRTFNELAVPMAQGLAACRDQTDPTTIREALAAGMDAAAFAEIAGLWGRMNEELEGLGVQGAADEDRLDEVRSYFTDMPRALAQASIDLEDMQPGLEDSPVTLGTLSQLHDFIAHIGRDDLDEALDDGAVLANLSTLYFGIAEGKAVALPPPLDCESEWEEIKYWLTVIAFIIAVLAIAAAVAALLGGPAGLFVVALLGAVFSEGSAMMIATLLAFIFVGLTIAKSSGETVVTKPVDCVCQAMTGAE